MPIDEVARDAAVTEARTAESVAEKAARKATIAKDEALHLLGKKTIEAAGLANANAILEVRVKEKIDEGQEIAARSGDLVNDANAAQSTAQVEANKAKADIGAVRDALTVKTEKVDELALAVTAHEAAAASSVARVAALETDATLERIKNGDLETTVEELKAELGRRPVPA